MKPTTLIGVTRDFLAAALGAYLLFGGEITVEQIGGLLVVVTTAVALGTFVYQAIRGARAS